MLQSTLALNLTACGSVSDNLVEKSKDYDEDSDKFVLMYNGDELIKH